MVCSLHQLDVRHRLSNASINFPAVSPNSGVDRCSILDKLWGELGAANGHGFKMRHYPDLGWDELCVEFGNAYEQRAGYREKETSIYLPLLFWPPSALFLPPNSRKFLSFSFVYV